MVTTFQESAAYLRNGNCTTQDRVHTPADECQRGYPALTLALNKVNDRLKTLASDIMPLELINDHLTPTTGRDAKRIDLSFQAGKASQIIDKCNLVAAKLTPLQISLYCLNSNIQPATTPAGHCGYLE